VLRSPLDRTDRLLVAVLQKNARISNKELAATAGIAPSTCLERVRALRARGVIRGYRAEVDPAALGRPIQAMIGVRVRQHSRELVDGFRDFALALPDTVSVYNVSGAEDFLVHVAVASTDALRDLLIDRIASKPEVTRVETHLIFDQARKPAVEPA
jgi:DNA-binding Lrp family transcriptional regulator